MEPFAERRPPFVPRSTAPAGLPRPAGAFPYAGVGPGRPVGRPRMYSSPVCGLQIWLSASARSMTASSRLMKPKSLLCSASGWSQVRSRVSQPGGSLGRAMSASMPRCSRRRALRWRPSMSSMRLRAGDVRDTDRVVPRHTRYTYTPAGQQKTTPMPRPATIGCSATSMDGATARRTSGFVGEFQERLMLSGRNARFHGRVMSLSFENTSVLASGPWLCSARRGGPCGAEVQGRSVRGDPS